jgi:hypothetical protein
VGVTTTCHFPKSPPPCPPPRRGEGIKKNGRPSPSASPSMGEVKVGVTTTCHCPMPPTRALPHGVGRESRWPIPLSKNRVDVSGNGQ